MTKRDIVSVAIKIVGVICLVFAATSIPPVFSAIGFLREPYGSEGSRIWYLLSVVVAPFWYLIVANVLLTWGDSFAARLVPEDSPVPPMGASGWGERVFGIAMRVVGVVLLVRGIPELVRGLLELPLRTAYQEGIGSETWVRFWPALGGAIVVILIGMYLITGARHVVRLLYPAQEGGTEALDQK